jgi:hypothetical protein
MDKPDRLGGPGSFPGGFGMDDLAPFAGITREAGFPRILFQKFLLGNILPQNDSILRKGTVPCLMDYQNDLTEKEG